MWGCKAACSSCILHRYSCCHCHTQWSTAKQSFLANNTGALAAPPMLMQSCTSACLQDDMQSTSMPLQEQRGACSVCITSSGGLGSRLLGILTFADIAFETDGKRKLQDVMQR